MQGTDQGGVIMNPDKTGNPRGPRARLAHRGGGWRLHVHGPGGAGRDKKVLSINDARPSARHIQG